MAAYHKYIAERSVQAERSDRTVLNLAKRSSLMWWIVLALAATAEVAGQSQPDFSGRWDLVRVEPADAQAAGTLVVQQPIVRTNARGAPMQPFFKSITIERPFVEATRTDNYPIGAEGGTVGGIIAGQDPQVPVPRTRFSVRWEGNRLVIDTGSYAGSSRDAGPYTERTETWQLDDAGLLTVTIADRRSDADSTTSIARYRRP